MTEEEKKTTTLTPEETEPAGDAKPETTPAQPQAGAPVNQPAPDQPGGGPPRPQNQQPGQTGLRPGSSQAAGGTPRPQNQGGPQGNRSPGSSPQGQRSPYPRPAPRPGDAQQPQGQPPRQGQQPSKPIDWLRSKPVPSGSRPPAPRRGLDLGRPDAWSGRQKPPTPGVPGQRPPQSDQRPGAPTSRPPDGARPYSGPRPAGTGAPYRPYQGSVRPGGPGRPGGFGGRPGAPTPTWGKATDASRRARSARKGGKEKEKPRPEEDADDKGVRLDARGKPLPGSPRLGMGKPLGKGKLDLTAPDLGKAILVPAHLTVKDLADVLNISSVEIIKELMKNGIMAPINQVIDFDTASIVASDLGFEIRQAEAPEAETPEPAAAPEATTKRIQVVEDDPSKLRPRPPVVTIMGHVDHGKTSLLDAIRRTNVAAGEFGGITQHIGAYQVEEKGQKITFLDTPGHEAFTAMRARGAQVTDVAVVVVAADDGVQPQTLEAINHARAAGVPIIVALNKIDKDNANPDHVKQQLSDAGLVPEEWGGNTVVVPVSAKKGTGVNDLLDMILLVAEIANLKANPDRPAVGAVVEAEMDKARGPSATVLVQHGTLSVGDYVVVGPTYGKIKAMFNDKGKAVRKATPSTPVSILGLSDVPQSGDTLQSVSDDRNARELAEREEQRLNPASAAVAPPMDLGALSKMIAAGMVRELDIVLKVDVQGSLEPIVNSLKKLSDEKENIQVRLLHQATGQITEGDVTLAAASQATAASKAAMVIGFNVEPDPAAKRTAEIQGVEIRTYKIIYDLVDAMELVVKGLYEPKYQEVVDGHAEVREIFKLNKGVTIAGSFITDGTLTRGAQIRVRRNDSVTFEGKVASLRRFKDDVREVTSGFECGITLDGFNDLQEKDVIESYHKERMN